MLLKSLKNHSTENREIYRYMTNILSGSRPQIGSCPRLSDFGELSLCILQVLAFPLVMLIIQDNSSAVVEALRPPRKSSIYTVVSEITSTWLRVANSMQFLIIHFFVGRNPEVGCSDLWLTADCSLGPMSSRKSTLDAG